MFHSTTFPFTRLDTKKTHTADGPETEAEQPILDTSPPSSPRSDLAHDRRETARPSQQQPSRKMIHELNNLVTPILFAAESLRTSVRSHPDQRNINLIIESAERCAAVLRKASG